jgi:hypothetical protein
VAEIVLEPRLRIRDLLAGQTVMETRLHTELVEFWRSHRHELDGTGGWVMQYLSPDGWRLVPDALIRAWRGQ